MRLCKQDIAAFRPDVVILIDYPGFNLKIAKYVKRRWVFRFIIIFLLRFGLGRNGG